MADKVEHIDYQTVRKLKRGDVKAFEVLFNKYASRLHNFSMGYLGSKEISEEIVQDVFLKIWEKRKEIKAEESFKSYLFTITFNSIRKYFLKKSRDEKYKQLFAEEFLFQNEGDDEKTEYDELLRIVDETIDKLTPKRREVFIMSRKEGLSILQISEKLGTAPQTVKNQLAEAARFIREEIKAKKNLGMILFHCLFVD